MRLERIVEEKRLVLPMRVSEFDMCQNEKFFCPIFFFSRFDLLALAIPLFQQ
jgi:hypothetical protein